MGAHTTGKASAAVACTSHQLAIALRRRAFSGLCRTPYQTLCCARNTQSNETSWTLPEGAAVSNAASKAYSPKRVPGLPCSRLLLALVKHCG